VQVFLQAEFPHLISYERFIQRLPMILEPLCVLLRTCFGRSTGIAFIGSTALSVCDNRRMQAHRVFAGLAARGKSSLGWFFVSKPHFIVNDRGELLAVRVTRGNVDDRNYLNNECMQQKVSFVQDLPLVVAQDLGWSQ
jgi:hypothetical protein